MSLDLQNLDDDTRKHMLSEIEGDIAASNLYSSPHLSSAGVDQYPDLLRQAATQGTDATLADALASAPGLFVSHYEIPWPRFP